MADPIATLPFASLRDEYTARVLIKAESLDDLTAAFLDVAVGGPRLLKLDTEAPSFGATILFGVNGPVQVAKSILALLLPRHSSLALFEAACDSVCEFGYELSEHDLSVETSLLSVITRAIESAQGYGPVLDEMVRLALLLMDQPSCTPKHIDPEHLNILLKSSTDMAVLPLIVTMQKRLEKPLAWQHWLTNLHLGTARPQQVELALRFLLETPFVAETYVLKQPQDAPFCTPRQLLGQLHAKLEEHTQVCRVGASVDAIDSSATTLHEWIRQQLEDLPDTFLSARLRDMSRNLDFGIGKFIVALVAALRDRPECVHLEERALNQSLIARMLHMNEEQWRGLESVVPVLISRIEAMDPGVMHSRNYGKPAFELFNLGEIDLLPLARSEAEGNPFDRLHWALVQKAIGLTSDFLPRETKIAWFDHLAAEFEGDEHDALSLAKDVRFIQRLFDLLELRGVANRTEFTWHIIRGNPIWKLCAWLDAHPGSEFPAIAASFVVEMKRFQSKGQWSRSLDLLPLTFELEQWIAVHLPMVRVTIEEFAIPDLASIVIEYLMPPLPPSVDALAVSFLADVAAGTRLIKLDDTVPTDQPTGVHSSQSVLAAMLPSCVRSVQLLGAVCASIQQFGYRIHSEDYVLDQLIDLATKLSTIDQTRVDLVRLGQLLLEQPAFSSTHFERNMRGAGVHCLSYLLGFAESLTLLPLAVAMQQRHSPPLPWQYWLPRVCMYSITSLQAELFLRFFHATPLACTARDGDEPVRSSWILLPSEHCTPTKLIRSLISKLEAHTADCTAEGATAESTAASASVIHAWISSQLDDLPNSCVSATLRDHLVSTTNDPDASGIAPLVAALRDRPEHVRLDESNTSSERLLDGVLRLNTAKLRALVPVMPALISRIEVMDPAAVFDAFRSRWIGDTTLMALINDQELPFTLLSAALIARAELCPTLTAEPDSI